MQWYYSIRGNAAQHGIADLDTLKTLASEGRLKPADLVWNKENGNCWFPAAGITGVFPEPEPVVETPPPPPPVEEDVAQGSVKAEKTKSSSTSAPKALVIVVILVFILGVGAAAYYFIFGPGRNARLSAAQSVSTTTTTIPEFIPPPLNYEKKFAEAKTLINEGDLDKAEDILNLVKQNQEYVSRVSALSVQIDTLRLGQSQLKRWEAMLRRGRVTPADAISVVNTYRDQNQLNALNTVLEEITHSDTRVLNTCLSAARVYQRLRNPEKAAQILNLLTQIKPETSDVDGYLSAASTLVELKKPKDADALLAIFRNQHPNSAPCLYEIAARQAAAEKTKDSLATLASAIQHGGTDFATKARNDSRFNEISDSRAFKKLVKP